MSRRGFTLIELLIALSILVIIVMVLYASFSSVTNTMDTSRVGAEEMRLRMFLERSFRSNLTSAYLDRNMEQDVFRFIGTDDESKDGPNDSLRFVSINNLMGGTGLPGELKEVRYGTIGGDESEFNPINFSDDPTLSALANQRKLEAVETPLFASNIQSIDPKTGGVQPASNKAGSPGQEDQNQSPTWSVPVRTLDISYFDGTKWVDEWDSQVTGRLPWCVRIKINFARTDQELQEEKDQGLDPVKDPDLEMVVPLPMGMGQTQDARLLEQMTNMQDMEETGDLKPPPDQRETSGNTRFGEGFSSTGITGTGIGQQ